MLLYQGFIHILQLHDGQIAWKLWLQFISYLGFVTNNSIESRHWRQYTKENILGQVTSKANCVEIGDYRTQLWTSYGQVRSLQQLTKKCYGQFDHLSVSRGGGRLTFLFQSQAMVFLRLNRLMAICIQAEMILMRRLPIGWQIAFKKKKIST